MEDYYDSKKSNKVEVLKSSYTSKSKGVYLLDRKTNNLSKVNSISKTFSLQNIKYLYQSIKKLKKHLFISNNRNKFIVQNYINNLKGDYRIIIYGNKYYSLYRENRENDFRASGSMRFHFDTVLPKGLLDFSKNIFTSLDVSFVALDIAEKNGEFFLFEFQVISFGQYTFEKSSGFYTEVNGEWNFIKETPDLELEFVTSIINYLKNKNICVQ